MVTVLPDTFTRHLANPTAGRVLAFLFAAMTASQENSVGAVVTTAISQTGNGSVTSSNINIGITNNDTGAIYNSFSLDFSEILSTQISDYLISNNVALTDTSDLYNAISFTPNNFLGWNLTKDTNAGIFTFQNNGGIADIDYDQFDNVTFSVSFGFGDLYDTNNNGQIDPNETIIKTGTAPNAFTAQFGATGQVFADVDQLAVIPEPGAPFFTALGLGAFALRRNHQKSFASM